MTYEELVTLAFVGGILFGWVILGAAWWADERLAARTKRRQDATQPAPVDGAGI